MDLFRAGTPAANIVGEGTRQNVCIATVFKCDAIADIMLIASPELSIFVIGSYDHVAISCDAYRCLERIKIGVVCCCILKWVLSTLTSILTELWRLRLRTLTVR